MPFLTIAFPVFDPIAISIGPIAIRWYALAYIGGIVIGWLYARALVKNEKFTPAMLVMAKAYFKLHKYEWVRTLFEMMSAFYRGFSLAGVVDKSHVDEKPDRYMHPVHDALVELPFDAAAQHEATADSLLNASH